MKLSKKISISFVMLFIILIMGILFLIRIIYGSFAFEQFHEQVDYSSKLISNQVQKYIESVEEGTADLVINLNREFENELQNKVNFDGANLENNQRIFSILKTSLNMKEETFCTSMISLGGVTFSVTKPNYFTEVTNQSEFRTFAENTKAGNKGSWYRIYNEEKKRVEYFHIRYLRHIVSMNRIGYAAIQMDTSTLKEVYKNESSSSYMEYYILDEDELVISGTESQYVGKNIKEHPALLQAGNDYLKENMTGNFTYKENKMYYTYSHIPNTSWSLITLMDHTQINQKLNVITLVIMGGGILLLLILSVAVNLVSKRLARPIVRLSEHLKNSEDGLPTEVEASKEYEEVEFLIQRFNAMVKNNKLLFSRIQEEEELKHKLEISIVQAQIKPHFLYNTLDTAYILVDMEESEKAKKTIKLLADYYRSVLNKGLVWTNLEREVGSVCTYLQIQQMRYPHLIEYEVEISSEVCQIYIPNLTLQPLVENAIYHGLKPSKKKGKIKIIGTMHNYWIYVDIVDNGIGFSQEKFKKLLEKNSQQEMNSFGMKNIEDRLKLCYGMESGLELRLSEKNETIVRIRIYLGSEGEK